MQPQLKAYAVHGYDAAAIVFATNGATARRQGGIEIDAEFEEVESCCRAHWADPFAETGQVPPMAFIENGWRISCGCCGRWIDQDGIDDEEESNGEPMAPVAVGGWIYCNAACHDQEVAELKERQDTEIATRQEAAAKFPGCEVLSYHVTACTPKPDKPTVMLAVPGLKKPATWHRGEDMVSVDQDDVEAWNRYREYRREVAA